MASTDARDFLAAGLKDVALTDDAASWAAVDLTAVASEADLIAVDSAVEIEGSTAAVDFAAEAVGSMVEAASTVEAADSMAAVEVASTVVAATEAGTGKTSKANS